MSIPPEFECPITLTIMSNPVSADDGHTYENDAIVHWLSDPRNNSRSPMTRAFMRLDTLRPNYAMKSQIERFLSTTPVVPQTLMTPTAFKDLPLVLEATIANDILNVKVIPPAEGLRQASLFIILLDVSGSTGGNTGAEVEAGARDFTILDLCKHTVRTIGGILGSNDMLCLITYSSTAKVVLRPTAMTKDGQITLDTILRSIKPEGHTNIWAALELMDRVASAPEFANTNIAAALLTDGMSNMNPGRGVLDTFKLYGKPSLYSLSTFGFGYSIDSKLLIGISSFSGGSFAFCPDFSMVATVFINWVSTTLASAAKPKTIKVPLKDGTVISLNTGTIQIGQPRTFTLRLTSEVLSVNMEDISVIPTQVDAHPINDMARFDLINSLKSLLDRNGDLTPIHGIYDKYKGTSAEVLMTEIKGDGQVVLGTQKDHWTRWGRHYIPAYTMAHELQQRMNYKDIGLQSYGSKIFEEIQVIGDNVFGSIEPFDPTGTMKGTNTYYTPALSSSPHAVPYSPAPPSAMLRSWTQTGGGAPGCWGPNSMVKMANGNRMPIQDIRKGDMVWTLSGPALVDYALEIGSRQTIQPMVNLDNLLITPWHPVLHNNVWEFPAKLGDIKEYYVPKVYNLIIEHGHIIDISGVLSVTLGHGFKGPVIEHRFFGNRQLVLYDIALLPGFNYGRPVFENIIAKKENGEIVGWYDGV